MSDKAVFVDRDHTLIDDPGYIAEPSMGPYDRAGWRSCQERVVAVFPPDSRRCLTARCVR